MGQFSACAGERRKRYVIPIGPFDELIQREAGLVSAVIRIVVDMGNFKASFRQRGGCNGFYETSSKDDCSCSHMACQLHEETSS